MFFTDKEIAKVVVAGMSASRIIGRDNDIENIKTLVCDMFVEENLNDLSNHIDKLRAEKEDRAESIYQQKWYNEKIAELEDKRSDIEKFSKNVDADTVKHISPLMQRLYDLLTEVHDLDNN